MLPIVRALIITRPWLPSATVILAGVVFSAGTVTGGSGEYLPICSLSTCLNPQVTTKTGIGTTRAIVEGAVTPEDAAKWCATYQPRDSSCPQVQVQTGWIGFKSLYRASADCVSGRMTAIEGHTYTYAGVWETGPGKGRSRFTSSHARFPSKQWDETGVQVDGRGIIKGWGGGSPNLAVQWELLCAGTPAPAVK